MIHLAEGLRLDWIEMANNEDINYINIKRTMLASPHSFILYDDSQLINLLIVGELKSPPNLIARNTLDSEKGIKMWYSDENGSIQIW